MQQIIQKPQKTERKEIRKKSVGIIKVRKASLKDVDGIFEVAASVGKSKKESTDGFLMDNYGVNPVKYKKIFSEKVNKLKYFYVAEMRNKVVGFLMGYTKEEWLHDNNEWIDVINWVPGFDVKKTEEFVLTDKIAIDAEYTGCGIGSRIYSNYMSDLNKDGIEHIFSETIIDPMPNFASLAFRKKQSFKLAGTRFERYNGIVYTDLIYYKPVNKKKDTTN